MTASVTDESAGEMVPAGRTDFVTPSVTNESAGETVPVGRPRDLS